MPRLYRFEEGQDDGTRLAPETKTGIVDLCSHCWEKRAEILADDLVDPPIDDPMGAEHPPYSDEDYDCEECEKRLTDLDN